MARLPLVNTNTATGKTRELLERIQKKRGKVPNILKVMANSPAAIAAYVGMYQALSAGVFSSQLREKIALFAATLNDYQYCIAAHRVAALKVGLSENDITESLAGSSNDQKEAAILQFVRIFIEHRADVSDEQLQSLKNAGVSDEEVVELIAVITLNLYTNYINHIAQTPIDTFGGAKPHNL